MTTTKKVLVADDEAIIRKVLEQELILAGYQVKTAVDGQQALDLCRNEKFSAVILDMKMPKQTGMEVLREMKCDPDTVIILITAHATINNAVEAIKLGADDYLTKPFDNQELIEKLENLMRLKDKRSQYPLQEKQAPPIHIVGNSGAANLLMTKLEKIKDINTTILLTGESGTGKSMIAKVLHNISRRKKEAFIHVDCTSLPPNLIESELFGHERGAFTNAYEQRKGKFEQAGAGTVFLDEISCLPLHLQSKLLNVLQERQVYRLGGARAYPILARIIAATNEDLDEAVKVHAFREDLYYRLNVIRIECPPLRYRKEDILALAEHFIRMHCQKMNKDAAIMDDSFRESLESYYWPGNVRELENVLESVLALSEKDVLTAEDLPIKLRNKATAPGSSGREPLRTGSLSFSLKDQELDAISKALKKNDGHRLKTAQDLGISRRTLQYKLKKMEEMGISVN